MKTEALAIPGEPAFKGSSFTSDEYDEVWGDTWRPMFMHLMHTQVTEHFHMEECC